MRSASTWISKVAVFRPGASWPTLLTGPAGRDSVPNTEFRIPKDAHDPAGARSQSHRAGLHADPGRDHGPQPAAGTAHYPERTRRTARRLAPASVAGVASAAPA